MPFTGIFDPEHLAVLSKVLNDHCRRHGIERFSADHLDASYLIMSLFQNGAQTAEELEASLHAALARDEKRRAYPV